MTTLLQAALLLAAFIFIAVSAAMNALFLSSLGRTAIEIGLLAAVSIAGDIAKFVLPIVLARAVLLRAWGYVSASSLMLMLVVMLSLASGIGFSAMTRGATTSARETASQRATQLKKHAAEIDQRIAALGVTQPTAVIAAELATLRIDRRYTATKSCAEVTGASARQFCSDVLKKEEALQRAQAQTAAMAERRDLAALLDVLQAAGSDQESDQQASAMAALFGISRDWPRVVVTSSVVVTLELGSILLVLLASGPMLRGWREPGSEPKPEPVPAAVPLQADRSHWQRKRGQTFGTDKYLGEHGRG